MRHGRFESKKRFSTIWIILILAVVSMSLGGVGAYLLHSADQPVDNAFIIESHPQVIVDDNYNVTVTSDYAVYLRAAIVVNWDNDGTDTVLPAKTGEYTLTPGTNWVKKPDGFYYYTKAVSKDLDSTLITIDSNNKSITIKDQIVTLSGTKPGYTLVANVAVQAIQAVGTVDGGTTPAVENAWGLTP